MITKGSLTVTAAALMFVSGLTVVQAPTAEAVCGSVGGRHFDVSGCSDPLYELNNVLVPPPPPGAVPPPPPPPPAPNVSVCANFGRRINVSGCV